MDPNLIDPAEVISLEHAGRMAMVWVPEVYDGKLGSRAVFSGALAATAVFATAVILLLSII